MDHNEVRKGNTQARFNESHANVLYLEIGFLALAAGLITKSWWWGGGVLLVLMIMLQIRPLAIILILLLSVVWGLFGYGIGSMFESVGAAVILSALAFFLGLAVHLAGLQWTKDVGE